MTTKIAIFGVGLIGGSLALCLKGKPGITVVGHAHRPESLKRIEERGGGLAPPQCKVEAAAAAAISVRRTARIPSMPPSTGGWCGLSTSPRSPPVHVTTRTSTPSAAYRAVVAAPLLDSSSGWACTAMRRSCSVTVLPSSFRVRRRPGPTRDNDRSPDPRARHGRPPTCRSSA